MTKDEALTAIMDAYILTPTLLETKEAIREILDQIDQPPAEFTVRELVELLGKIGGNIRVESLHYDGYWKLKDIHGTFQSQGMGISSLKAKLLELANPQPPEDKVTIQISRKLAELFTPDWLTGEMAVACREALKTPAT